MVLSRFVFALIGAVASLLAGASAAVAGPIEDLQPGQWYRVPNSKLNAVLPNPVPAGNPIGIMLAWSGGAFDSRRDRLLVWGGGHGDYGGNELYAFDLNTLAWSRLTEPSRNTSGTPSSGVYADGLPRSTHTYSTLEYSPTTDRFVFIGMGGVFPTGEWSQNSGAYDFGSNQWVRLRTKPSGGAPDSAVIARDSSTGTIWYIAGQDRNLHKYDASADTYQTFTSTNGGWTGLYMTAAIDPGRKLMVNVGRGEIGYWRLDNPAGLQHPASTGDKGIESANAPGFEFNPSVNKFVAWDGGADVYVLDPSNWSWQRTPPAASNTVIPTASAQWGTFGRFRYSPNKNVFVVVNNIDQDVYLYKLSPPPKKPMPVTNLTAQ